MVHKKVAPKLPLQVDHVAVNKKQLHSHDFKNTKGPDLKTKKMKKTGPTNTQDLAKKPAKTGPTAEPPVCSAATPNYMKSTTSSDARREVSTKGLDHDLSMKITKNLKPALASANKHKATKAKTKTVRTLTKNPSFKPARAISSAMKCSRVVLCENLQAQRATCSSTMKDCKFPAYLSLNPGGTESEGTSVMKVCPYTYCSLNGHHHPPLPPLKCFLAARRCSIKAQRSLKLGCLSPRRAKGGVVKEGPEEDEKIGVDNNLEEHEDFFVEIFSGKNKDYGNKSGIIERDEMEDRVQEEILMAKNCEKADTKETLDQEGDMILMGGKVEKGVFSPFPDEDTKEGILSELSGETMMGDVILVESDSEASDMEWEKGYHSVLYLDFDYECEKEMELDDPEAGKGFESQITNDEFIIENTSHKIVCFDEFSADELSQVSIDDDRMFHSEAFSNSDDSNESTDSYNTIKSSNPDEAPAEEQDDMTNSLMLSQIFPDESHIQNQEKPIENFTNPSPIDDQAKEPQSEVPQLIPAKFKSENKAKTTETEDVHLILAITKSERPTSDTDESGPFNPRSPNFLPLEPDPEAERVDLKHQDLDDRKNAEEWMVDYALRQAVTRLGPKRKRKVALLVEAFEKVMPVTKCELKLGRATEFGQTRPMQACN